MLGRGAASAAPATAFTNPLAAKPQHFPSKAKSVIYLFMHGGPSHVDTFDPKPALAKYDGQPTPASFGNVFLQFTKASEAPLMASRRTFKKYGQSGLEISDLFSNVAQHADDLAVIRSCYHDGFTHSNALNWMNNGWPRLGRPSVGSWVVYGLGSQSDNLPAYVVMLQGNTKSGPTAYSSGFLPAMYQGTVLRSNGTPILNVRRPDEIGAKDERDMLDMLKWYNERHLETRSEDSDLAARIASYELAFRMQIAAPELVELSKETDATKKLYGIDDPITSDYGTKCLMARRMVERGVRFIQLYSGSASGKDWDGHNQCDKNHLELARTVDKPVAGLLTDLKARGLARQHAGDLGRRVRADAHDGWQRQRRHRRRTRSQSLRLQRMDGGRRDSRRQSDRRDRRDRIARGHRQSARARFPRDHPGAARRGS